MSGAYRVELATSNRSGCVATDCKKNNFKIPKGELRQGVTVVIKEHTTIKWRHWGCVTPAIVRNWKEASNGDMEFVDGYDTLPDDAQEKVRRTFEQGHVDDEDWNGDVELNRPSEGRSKGMMLKGKAKKAADSDEDEPVEKVAKKRSRKQANDEDEDDVDEKPAPKKARGKKAKDETDEATSKKAKSSKTKSSKVKADSNRAEDQDEHEAAPKKGKAKKATAAVKAEPSSDAENVEDEDPEPTPKAKKSAGKKTCKATGVNGNEQPSKRKTRTKKVAEDDD